MKYVVLFNSLAGKDGNNPAKTKLEKLLAGDEVTFEDVTKVDAAAVVKKLDKDAAVIIAGGDGTLNRFVNAVNCEKLKNKLYLFPSGNGNDFCNDIAATCEAFTLDGEQPEESAKLYPINEYVTDLPVATVNGKSYKFINGVGFGIDGYCCEVGDNLKAAGKKVNYTSIAVKGLLFHFKPKNATVTVDGTAYHFKKAWIAPTMIGRYYGGGMIPTPAQNRKSDKLSICVMYGKGKLPTLIAFPKIFKGEHVKKENMVTVLEGSEITVEFDSPCALQIDGETFLNVTSYTAKRNA